MASLNGALQAVAECVRWFPELASFGTGNAPWKVSVEVAPYM